MNKHSCATVFDYEARDLLNEQIYRPDSAYHDIFTPVVELWLQREKNAKSPPRRIDLTSHGFSSGRSIIVLRPTPRMNDMAYFT